MYDVKIIPLSAVEASWMALRSESGFGEEMESRMSWYDDVFLDFQAMLIWKLALVR